MVKARIRERVKFRVKIRVVVSVTASVGVTFASVLEYTGIGNLRLAIIAGVSLFFTRFHRRQSQSVAYLDPWRVWRSSLTPRKCG